VSPGDSTVPPADVSSDVEWEPGSMSESDQTRHTYRLLDPDGAILGERELPTDGEALTWAEEVRGEGAGIVVLRVERSTGDGWTRVDEGGSVPEADRDADDL
jgi:hypothetical protein